VKPVIQIIRLILYTVILASLVDSTTRESLKRR